MFRNRNSNVQVYSIDPSLNYELETMFETNIPIRRIVSMLEAFLLTEVTVKNATPIFQRYVKHYMIPFLRDALRQSIVYGWCAISKMKVKDDMTGQTLSVPTAVPLKYFNVELHVDRITMKRNWSFINSHNNREDKSIQIAHLYGEQNYEVRGAVFSPLLCLLPKFRFQRQMEQNFIRAEFIRSNPHIYLREAKTNPLSSTDTMQANDYYSSINGLLECDDALNREATLLGNSYRHTEANIELHKQQQQHLSRNAAESQFIDSTNQIYTQYDNNLFVCPPNMELAATPQMPVSTISLLELETRFEADVVQAFGLPVRALHSSGVRATPGRARVNAKTSSSGSASYGNSQNSGNLPSALDLAALDAGLTKYRDFLKSLVSKAYKVVFKLYLDPDLVIISLPPIYQNLMNDAIGNENTEETPPDKN